MKLSHLGWPCYPQTPQVNKKHNIRHEKPPDSCWLGKSKRLQKYCRLLLLPLATPGGER